MCLSHCSGNTFSVQRISSSARDMCPLLSHKGYNRHKSNHRFSATWILLCVPGTMFIPNIIALFLLAHNNSAWFDHYLKHPLLSPPNFLHLASSLMKLVGMILFHLSWDKWLRPGYFSLWRHSVLFLLLLALLHMPSTFPPGLHHRCLCSWATHMHFFSLANLF